MPEHEVIYQYQFNQVQLDNINFLKDYHTLHENQLGKYPITLTTI